MMTVDAISAEKCCGCAACVDKCPVGAIKMHYDNEGNRVPFVDSDICISCGQCIKVCPAFNESERCVNNEFSVFLGSYKNSEIESRSSSGGLFAAFAIEILKHDGIVYGAAMLYKDGEVYCQHIRIDKSQDLHLLQGSKYIQSKTDGIYKKVKFDLKEGKKVLFSGTSCQVASLKRFVGKDDNLYTIDLVCHGVPKDQLFKNYIKYCEDKFNCKIVDVSFRSKGIVWHRKEMKHVLTLTCNKNGLLKRKVLVEPKSSFYCLFMSRAGYRSSCYNCVYASVDKPADITLGDYTLSIEESKKYDLPINPTYSTILVRTDAGKQLLELAQRDLIISEVSSDEVIVKHGNLNHPSKITDEGKRMYSVYLEHGFTKLQKIIDYSFLKTNIKWGLESIPMTIKSFLGIIR